MKAFLRLSTPPLYRLACLGLSLALVFLISYSARSQEKDALKQVRQELLYEVQKECRQVGVWNQVQEILDFIFSPPKVIITGPAGIRELPEKVKNEQTRREYRQALDLVEKAWKTRQTQAKVQPPGTAAALNNLAVLYLDLGQNREADSLLKLALDDRNRKTLQEDPELAAILNNLAATNVQAAMASFRAGQIIGGLLGASLGASMGLVSGAAKGSVAGGLTDSTLAQYQKALNIWEKKLGPEHPHTAATLVNLAWLYQQRGKSDQARPIYQRALSIYERLFGPDSPEVLACRRQLELLDKAPEKKNNP